jgi:hypothetical protein
MNELQAVAYQLADEIRDRKWDHVLGPKPAPDCIEITTELARRCPGYTVEQYKRAIATGLFESW